MSSSTKHVLWLDDEWGTAREAGLGPWMRALNAELRVHGHILTMCNKLQDFAAKLREHQAPPETAVVDERRFDLLILDVMLANEQESDYGSLEFPDERVFALDAGAQIAGFIRSSKFDSHRPAWLATYRDVPMILLSSSPTLNSLVEREVGYRRMQNVHVVSKSLVVRTDRSGVEAETDFTSSLRQLLGE